MQHATAMQHCTALIHCATSVSTAYSGLMKKVINDSFTFKIVLSHNLHLPELANNQLSENLSTQLFCYTDTYQPCPVLLTSTTQDSMLPLALAARRKYIDNNDITTLMIISMMNKKREKKLHFQTKEAKCLGTSYSNKQAKKTKKKPLLKTGHTNWYEQTHSKSGSHHTRFPRISLKTASEKMPM